MDVTQRTKTVVITHWCVSDPHETKQGKKDYVTVYKRPHYEPLTKAGEFPRQYLGSHLYCSVCRVFDCAHIRSVEEFLVEHCVQCGGHLSTTGDGDSVCNNTKCFSYGS